MTPTASPTRGPQFTQPPAARRTADPQAVPLWDRVKFLLCPASVVLRLGSDVDNPLPFPDAVSAP